MSRIGSLLRFRYLALALLAAIVVTVGSVSLFVASLTPGRPGKFTGEVQKLIADAQPGGTPDRWPLFLQTLDRYKSVDDPLRRAPRPSDWPDGLSWPPAPEELDPASPSAARALRELLARHDAAGLAESLDQLAAAERVIRPIPPGRLLDVLLPELLPTRSLAKLSQARFNLAVAEGKEAEAIRAIEHILGLAEVCQKQSTLIEHLVASSCRAQALSALQESVPAGRFSPEGLRRLRELLDRRVRKIDATRTFKGEHLFARDTVEWTHSDDGRGDGSFIPAIALPMIAPYGSSPSKVPPFLANFGALASPSKKATLQAFDRYYELAGLYAAAPWRVRDSMPPPDAYVQALPQNMLLVRYITPALTQFVRSVDADDLNVAATKVVLALEQHHAARGAYPDRLDDLGPLPMDPQWRPELRYQPARSPADPGPYLLYWIGRDGVDQHGLHPPKSDGRGFLQAGDGFDYVFVPAHPAHPSAPAPDQAAKPGPATP